MVPTATHEPKSPRYRFPSTKQNVVNIHVHVNSIPWIAVRALTILLV